MNNTTKKRKKRKKKQKTLSSQQQQKDENTLCLSTTSRRKGRVPKVNIETKKKKKGKEKTPQIVPECTALVGTSVDKVYSIRLSTSKRTRKGIDRRKNSYSQEN